MFHKKVLGIPSGNLDLFLAGRKGVSRSILEGMEGRDIAVIEGVMGFFDGMGKCEYEGSSHDLCVRTGTPAILVVNCRGMSRSVIPLVKGFLEYLPDGPKEQDMVAATDTAKGFSTRDTAQGFSSPIRGVILNNISPMIAPDISDQIKKELGIPVLGFLPKLDGELLGSRHLGLIMPDEVPEVIQIIDRVALELEKSFDTDI